MHIYLKWGVICDTQNKLSQWQMIGNNSLHEIKLEQVRTWYSAVQPLLWWSPASIFSLSFDFLLAVSIYSFYQPNSVLVFSFGHFVGHSLQVSCLNTSSGKNQLTAFLVISLLQNWWYGWHCRTGSPFVRQGHLIFHCGRPIMSFVLSRLLLGADQC